MKAIRWFVAVVILAGTASAGPDDGPKVDVIPIPGPDAPGDFQVVEGTLQESSVTLEWLSPAGIEGDKCETYDVRISTEEIIERNFDEIEDTITDEPFPPLAVGERETMSLTGLVT